MSHHFEFPSVGAGDWVDITPLERKRNHEFSSFVFKGPLINRVQRCFRWPLDKVHVALAEYMRLLMLKEELGDVEGHIVIVPPVIARVWECHIIDTVDYRNCMEKVMGEGVFFNYSPEMTNAFEDEIRTEKISQLEMFYRGKFGHDPDPLYWSFDALPSNPVSINASGPSIATIRRQGNAGSATYPVGSGRFPRDGGGTMRLGRSDRPLRARSPPFRSRWRDDDEDSKTGSGDAPYLPNLRNFIGDYRRNEKDDADVQVEMDGVVEEPEAEGSGVERKSQQQLDEGADPGPIERKSSLSADTPVVPVAPSGRLINFVLKCREPRVRLVITQWPADSPVHALKKHIRDTSSDQLPNEFHLSNLGKRIDSDEAKSMAEVGTLDGDIINIQPC